MNSEGNFSDLISLDLDDLPCLDSYDSRLQLNTILRKRRTENGTLEFVLNLSGFDSEADGKSDSLITLRSVESNSSSMNHEESSFQEASPPVKDAVLSFIKQLDEDSNKRIKAKCTKWTIAKETPQPNQGHNQQNETNGTVAASAAIRSPVPAYQKPLTRANQKQTKSKPPSVPEENHIDKPVKRVKFAELEPVVANIALSPLTVTVKLETEETPESVIDTFHVPTTDGRQRFFLVKWKDLEKPEWILESICKSSFPNLVFEFFENERELKKIKS